MLGICLNSNSGRERKNGAYYVFFFHPGCIQCNLIASAENVLGVNKGIVSFLNCRYIEHMQNLFYSNISEILGSVEIKYLLIEYLPVMPLPGMME